MVTVEFASPSSLLREQHRASMLPILGNGPPGTFVLFPEGWRVSLPTDQVTCATDSNGRVTVTFGGMDFVSVDGDVLVLLRVREMLPEDQLSPARSHTMRLDTRWVTRVSRDGQVVWP